MDSNIQSNNNETNNEGGEGETLLLKKIESEKSEQTENKYSTTLELDDDDDMGLENVEAQKNPQYLTAAAVNLLGITAGMALGWASPSISKLKQIEENPLGSAISVEQESWVGSLIALGAALGPFPAGIACDKMGRKTTLLISAIPFIISWFIIGTTCNVTQILAARFLLGIGVGATFTALPMYIGEIADSSVRGALGSFLQLFVTLGILLSFWIGPYVSFSWLATICSIFPLIFIVVFQLFPDSPWYLVAADQKSEARKALKKIRGLQGPALDKELSIVQASVDEAQQNKGSFSDILNNRGSKTALFLSLGLVTGQQLAGINVVLFYTETIFAASGSSTPAEISTIIIGAVQFLASGVTPMIVERLGRKILLMVSAAGMSISLFALGTYFYLKNNGTDVSSIGILPVGSLIVYIIVFCIGFGPLPWAVMGELFPGNIKSLASTVTASFCWFMGFLITKFFSNIVDVIQMSGAFWMFSILSLIAGWFVYKFLPETKGKTLQQIQDELNGVTNANNTA